MKKSRFSEEQVVRILQEVEAGKSVREVCRAHGVSENTFYLWRRKYGGMETQDVKRLRELEAENSALKRIVADQVLIIDASVKLLRKTAPRMVRKLHRLVGRHLAEGVAGIVELEFKADCTDFGFDRAQSASPWI